MYANKNIISNKLNFNKILPVFSYSIATFFLMDFAFFINDIVSTLHFTYLESYILLGIPFVGRMVTPFVYSSFGRIGVPRLALTSITLMAIISLLMGYETYFFELLISRFVIGILFGLATSAAIEVASITRSRVIVGLTMGGWAIGWLLGAIFFALLKSWELVSIAGIIFVPAILFSKKHNVISPALRKFHFDFSSMVIKPSEHISSESIYLGLSSGAYTYVVFGSTSSIKYINAPGFSIEVGGVLVVVGIILGVIGLIIMIFGAIKKEPKHPSNDPYDIDNIQF